MFLYFYPFSCLCVCVWCGFHFHCLSKQNIFNVYYSYGTATTVLIIIVIAHTTTVSDLNVFISLLSAVTFCDCLLCQLICVYILYIQKGPQSCQNIGVSMKVWSLIEWHWYEIWTIHRDMRLLYVCVYLERETKLQYKRFWLW